MKREERAVQLWSILVLAARARQILRYEDVAAASGIAPVGLGGNLEPVQSYCLREGLPPLTAIVVSKETGLPSYGFTAAAQVPAAQMRVFEFDWLGHGCPKPDDLADALRTHPSRGTLPA